jgi:hypothetical protein
MGDISFESLVFMLQKSHMQHRRGSAEASREARNAPDAILAAFCSIPAESDTPHLNVRLLWLMDVSSSSKQ